MLVEELCEGKIYNLTVRLEGYDVGTPVVFKRLTKDSKYAICCPLGQAAIAVDYTTELVEV